MAVHVFSWSFMDVPNALSCFIFHIVNKYFVIPVSRFFYVFVGFFVVGNLFKMIQISELLPDVSKHKAVCDVAMTSVVGCDFSVNESIISVFKQIHQTRFYIHWLTNTLMRYRGMCISPKTVAQFTATLWNVTSNNKNHLHCHTSLLYK